MKIWACLELRPTGALGLPSRAAGKIGERSVLEHTVARLRKTGGIEGIALLVQPGGKEAARELLGSESEGTRVLEILRPDTDKREGLRRSRKWSKDSWRLGIRQSMEMDGSGHFASLAAAAGELGADAVLSVSPESALVCPELLEGLIEHGAPEGQPPLPTAICQAPGGFAGLFAMAGWLEPMSGQDGSYGQLFAWRPDAGSSDPVHRAENWLAPVSVRRCEFRGASDARRYHDIITEVIRRSPGPDGLGPSAEEAVAIVTGDPALYAGRLPRIVEVELTTAGRVPFAQTPQSVQLPERQMSREMFTKLLDDLSDYDDVLMTLGGPGDPLEHPEIFEFIDLARGKGIYGLHLDTPGVSLDEQKISGLVAADLDVVSFRLGANTPETYKLLTGRDDFEAVTAGIEKLVEARRAGGREWPFVAVETDKRVESEGELIEFWDRWSQGADWPVVRPFSDYCGRFEDRAVVHLTLAERKCCRRLLKEMYVLADGTVPVCRMDFEGRDPAGSLASSSLEELWTSGRIAQLRSEQFEKKFGGFKLCGNCRDWDNV